MEKWKPIIGYEDLYLISNLGRVKRLSFKRVNKLTGGDSVYKEKILKPYDRKGYLAVRLSNNKEQYVYSVHRLVAMNFISTENLSLQVNHIDGDKLNNHVSNLEWCTAKENTTHAIKNNLWIDVKGSRNGMSKLEEKEVKKIITELKNGKNYRQIAKDFNVSHKTISSIKNKTTWKHISI